MKTDRSKKWYLADLVVAISVEGEREVVLHRNTVLVRASNDEDAYAHAVELGQQANYTDTNPSDRSIVSEFVGVASLSFINDDIEDGAELAFSELLVPTVDSARAAIPEKSELAVFNPVRPSAIDYRSKDVVEMMNRLKDPQT